MTWTESNAGNVTFLKLEGEFDLQHTGEVQKFLATKIAGRCPVLVFDFEDVQFIDSSGIATLISYYKDSQAFGGKIALTHVPDVIQKVFEMISLGTFFPMFETNQMASDALATS